ncbi:MAG: glycosyltransferase family 2 protein [Bacteroidales bacterium]|nr:glycosyltransferase family 2 protein [Bacteroidales bacterium]
MDISIVIPFYNEEESLQELVAWIERVMSEQKLEFEIIMVDDGSSDASWRIVESMSESRKHLKAIKFRRNYGKSAALQCGFQASQGKVVITMDADLQDSPEEIPALYHMIINEGYDLVSGWKKIRHDPISKRLPSKVYNAVARWVTGIKLHDFNCGLKAYRQQVVKSIEVYGDMHRNIPFLAKQAGFKKIGEKVVQHRKRQYGVSKYGWQRFVTGFLDLITLVFITKFGRRPMHFFGVLGTLMFIFGFMWAAFLGIEKLYAVKNHIKAPLVTSNPYFYLALVAMILGTQLFLSGFLAELIVRTSSDRNSYLIDQKINLKE